MQGEGTYEAWKLEQQGAVVRVRAWLTGRERFCRECRSEIESIVWCKTNKGTYFQTVECECKLTPSAMNAVGPLVYEVAWTYPSVYK